MPRLLQHLIAAASVLVVLSPAAAVTFTVTKSADTNDGACDADCSLREAVVAANADDDSDTIMVPPGTYGLGGAGGEDLAASGDLDLRESVTIVGAGAGTTTVDGGGVDRIFDIVQSATVTISGMTLTNGHVPAGDTQGGGAILWEEPFSNRTLDLTLDGVVVTGNHSGRGPGGGIRIDQEQPGSAVLDVRHSTISHNTMSDGDGGGLHLCCENLTATIEDSTITANTAVDDPTVPPTNGEGGGIYHCCTGTTLTIDTTTISGNIGPTQGGGLYTCCGVEANTLVTIDRSTVSDNDTLGTTNQFQGFGGGIEAEGAVTLVNSTLSGNRASRDGGGIDNEDVLTLGNVTIADNQAARGAGLYQRGAAVTLRNTLLAGNVLAGPAATPSNCESANFGDPIESLGGNLSSDATCPLAGTGDQQSVDPALDALADNGGPTATRALPSTSPAVDQGLAAGCPAIDQRGFERPSDGDNDGGAACDVGAYELASIREDCDNGVDDNQNGRVDCADFECAGMAACPEVCGNCIDDDGNGKVDGDDTPTCSPPSDGGGAGIADPVRGKLLAECAKALRKSGGKLLAAHLGALQKCVGTLSNCVQRKPANAACLAKGGAACSRRLATLGKTEDKARQAIVTACDPLTVDELRTATGLGQAGEAEACSRVGVPSVADAAGVAACVAAQHRCAAQQIAGLEAPRARELTALAGLDPAAVLACAYAPADGGGAGLGANAKAAVSCERALQKAGAKLVGGALRLWHTCADAVFACVQQRADDPTCLAKARVACPKAAAKIAALESKLAALAAKQCALEDMSLGELLGPAGIGFHAQGSFCRALGVPALGSADAVATCVIRADRCRVRQLLEHELPRARELLSAGDALLP